MNRKQIFGIVRRAVTVVWIAGLFVLETRRALRPVRNSKIRRDMRNLLMAAPAGAVMQCMDMPIALALAGVARRRRWGLIPQLRIPGVLAIVLLDYTLYWWHFLTHRVPVLWRFHQVHHLDHEMDATTGLRFHFGEMTISVAFRAAQMTVIGPPEWAVATWQLFLFLCVLFHHSNVRLPLRWERVIARVVVTPRLHGIHHSIVPEQVNSNWSSGLTIWDWLHGTLRTDTPQNELVLGVRDLHADGFWLSLWLPFWFRGQPPAYSAAVVRQPIRLLR